MSVRNLKATVIDNGFCIGCGACAVVAPGNFHILTDQRGQYQAQALSLDDIGGGIDPEQVCPFSERSKNEDELAAVFIDQSSQHDNDVGRYLQCYTGKVADKNTYTKSSSGGIGRWLLSTLVKENVVDAVIHVTGSARDKIEDPIFEFTVSSDPEDILRSSKSAYYPVEMSRVLQHVKSTPGNYAITGVPCFIKAVRNLMLVDPVFRERIRFTVGIVCGHLKSKFYAEMIGWQMGVQPENLANIDFRVKLPGRKANEKGVAVTDLTAPGKAIPPVTVQQLMGTNYGIGYFKYNACDYCDDVLAETADISIGDAWLPEYLHEGTSIVTVRNKELQRILVNGVAAGELKLTEVSARTVATSQDAGLRHRRQGLAYRLHLKKEIAAWHPPKRVEATKYRLNARERKIHLMRLEIAKASFDWFQKAKAAHDWSVFAGPMGNLNLQYAKLYRRPVLKFFNNLKRKAKKILIMLRIRPAN